MANEDGGSPLGSDIVPLPLASVCSLCSRLSARNTKGGGQRPPPFRQSLAQRPYLHFGSASTTAGVAAATPMKIAQVRVVALCAAVALQPVPPVFAATTWTPAEGTKPESDAVVPPWFVAVPLVYTW